MALRLGAICAMTMLGIPQSAHAATPAADHDAAKPRLNMAAPDTALLTPTGGRLAVTQHIAPQKSEAGQAIEFVIPGDASNLQMDAPGNTIIRWDSLPYVIQPTSAHSRTRQNVENERALLVARLATIKARLAVGQAQTAQAGAQELEQRQNLMGQQMPALAREQEEAQKRLRLVEQELAQMPGAANVGKLVTVTLAGHPEKDIQINYSYDLSSCGWQPVYEFNARPNMKSGDMVDVHMLAEVWQFSGMDWKGTAVTLATLGYGPREPEPLPRWIVGTPAPTPKPQPRAAAGSAAKNARAADAAPVMLSATPPQVESAAPVLADTDSLYASWTLSAKGMPEGRFHLEITSDTWKTPLQWLARPSDGDNRVWLLCKYDLPQTRAWPAGTARFSVDGQSIGNGVFRPKSGNAELFFGADPRVSVHTTIDSSKQGETGFINTSKTWTGAWTYTITNRHDREIRVKVERPAPMVANDNITVTYNDKPKSTVDNKEHMIFWDVDVAAHGKAVIEHEITISSPEKLPLLPDVP